MLNIDNLLIDPVGNAENELKSLFARQAQRSQATGNDTMSQKVMAGSKRIPARSGFNMAGVDRWLEKKPRK